MRKLKLLNEDKRDATIKATSPKRRATPQMGIKNDNVTFRRYLAANEGGLHGALVTEHGEDYGQMLIDGDPEIDMEVVGTRISDTDTVFLTAEGAIQYSPPEIVEVVLDTAGVEKERRKPIETSGNINDTTPLRWSKMRLKRSELVRRFAFKRTLQLHHVDGLTYDFLYNMAKTLHDADEAVYIGAGEKGRDAIILQDNGAPYRGFLEGRVDGEKYKLLLHLSALELKRPTEVQS